MRVSYGAYGFIQTERRLNLSLERCVVQNVVVREWLFNHHQLEFVQRTKERRVRERVSGISVGHQGYLGKARAHLFDNINVPARFDFDFDSTVTSRQLALDFVEQDFHGLLYAYGNSTGNFFQHAPQMSPERNARAPRFQIPAGRLNRGLRHTMPAHRAHQIAHLRGVRDPFSQHHRRKKILQGVPRRFGPLFGIKRPFTCGAFAPALRAVLVHDAHEDDASRGRATKTCLENMYEAQTNLAQLDPCDFHAAHKITDKTLCLRSAFFVSIKENRSVLPAVAGGFFLTTRPLPQAVLTYT